MGVPAPLELQGFRTQAAVVGGGPAGVAAALALSRLLNSVYLIAPAPPPGAPPERRTAALFTGSIRFLENLGVWPGVAPASAAIRAIRIIDDTGGLLRPPEVLFQASEVGLDAFGYNVPNHALNDALASVARSTPNLTLLTTAVDRIEIAPDGVGLVLKDGRSGRAELLVGSDGRASPARAAAGIATKTWTYPQTAIVCDFAHSRPHRDISTELHRPPGPLTTVPMPGQRSSLVWVERPEEAQRLLALPDGSFLGALEHAMQGLLGSLSDLGSRAAFPLSGLSVDTAGQNRVALVGESAHVVPPIGAQGLNLGLRDGAALADSVASALATDRPIASPETLRDYAQSRSADIGSRIIGVDVLNRTLIADILPTHLARGFGLHLLKTVGPLRRFLVREGLHPSFTLPTLMQPDGVALIDGRARPRSSTGLRAQA